MIELTPRAAREIKRLQSMQPEASLFNLTVADGGCCGLAYVFNWQSHPEGITYTSQNIKICLNPETMSHWENLTIDYAEDLMGGGFRFTNPKASQTCSCTQSFAIS